MMCCSSVLSILSNLAVIIMNVQEDESAGVCADWKQVFYRTLQAKD